MSAEPAATDCIKEIFWQVLILAISNRMAKYGKKVP